MDIPHASPKAISCGDPFILFRFRKIYFFVLFKLKNILKVFLKNKKIVVFFLLPNGIYLYFINLLPGLLKGSLFKKGGRLFFL